MMLPSSSLITKVISINRGSRGYGFILSNQAPCIVSNVTSHGPAEKAGIKVGDKILKVELEDVSRATHEQVVKLILRCREPYITLEIQTSEKEPADKNKENYELTENGQDEKQRELLLKSVNEVVEELQLQEMFRNTTNAESPTRNISKLALSLQNEERCSPSISPISVTDDVFDPVCEFVVGYLCTIEIPRCSSLPSTSLNAINDCVRRLQRSNQKVNSLVLMRLTSLGISLINTTGSEIVTYSVKSLAFSGVCPEDKKYFGLVTRKLDQEILSNATSPTRSPKLLSLSHKMWTCSCHVFVVEPNMSTHSVHQAAAESFDISCTFCTEFGGCKEFPQSPAVISHAINSLYHPDSIDNNPDKNSETYGSLTSLSSQSSLSLRSYTDATSVIDGDKLFEPHHRSKNSKLSPKNSQSSLVLDSTFSDDGDCEDEDAKDGDGIIPYTKYLSQLKRHCEETAEIRDQQIAQETKAYSEFKREHSKSPSTRKQGTGVSPLKRQGAMHRLSSGDNVPDGSQNQVASTSTILTCSYSVDSRNDLWELRKDAKRASDVIPDKPEAEKPKSNGRALSASDSVYDVPSRSTPHPRHASLPSGIVEVSSRVELWAKSFNKLLDDEIGLRCFLEFLKKEFSEENIRFWIACEQFKRIKEKDKMKSIAGEIFNKHLGSEAALLVNVDQPAVLKAEQNLSDPDSNMFDIAQKQVFMLMKFDSYPRFLKSDLYRQCLTAENDETHIPFDVEPFGECNGKKVYINERKLKLNNKDAREVVDKKWSLLNFLSKGKQSTADILFSRGRTASLGSLSGGSSSESIPGNVDAARFSHPLKIRSVKNNQEAVIKTMTNSSSCQFCRVVLPNGTSAVLMAETGTPVRVALQKLCSRQRLSFTSFDAYVGSEKKLVDLDHDISTLADCVIYLERKILFRLDLPNNRSVGMKVHSSITLQDAIGPVLEKNGFKMETLILHLAENKIPLNREMCVAFMENKHIVAHTVEQFDALPRSTSSSSPIVAARRRNSETDNSFLGGITGSQSTDALDKIKQHQESLVTSPKNSRSKSVDILGDTPKKLMENIGKLQCSRLDDQRGLLPKHLELPDFLKLPTTKQMSQKRRRDQGVSASFHVSDSLDVNRPLVATRSDSVSHSSYDRSSLCSVQSWSGSVSPRDEDGSHGKTDNMHPNDETTMDKPRLKRASGRLSLEKMEQALIRRRSSNSSHEEAKSISERKVSKDSKNIANISEQEQTPATHTSSKVQSNDSSDKVVYRKPPVRRVSATEHKSHLRIHHPKPAEQSKPVPDNLVKWRNRTNSNDSAFGDSLPGPRFERSQSLDVTAADTPDSPDPSISHRFSVANCDVASFRSPIRSTLLTMAKRRPRPKPMTLDDEEAQKIVQQIDSGKICETPSPQSNRRNEAKISVTSRDGHSPVSMVTIGELEEMTHPAISKKGIKQGLECCTAVASKTANDEYDVLENKINGIKFDDLRSKRHSSPAAINACYSPLLTSAEKRKLISGDTIYSKQKERITFV